MRKKVLLDTQLYLKKYSNICVFERFFVPLQANYFIVSFNYLIF